MLCVCVCCAFACAVLCFSFVSRRASVACAPCSFLLVWSGRCAQKIWKTPVMMSCGLVASCCCPPWHAARTAYCLLAACVLQPGHKLTKPPVPLLTGPACTCQAGLGRDQASSSLPCPVALFMCIMLLLFCCFYPSLHRCVVAPTLIDCLSGFQILLACLHTHVLMMLMDSV